MPTRKQTISVRLDAAAKQRVERAARLQKQSSGAFLEKAGEEQARQVLLTWALERHQSGEASFSELAAETGLAIEEIMWAAGRANPESDLDQFIHSARSLARTTGNPELARVSERAAESVKREYAERNRSDG